MELVEFPATPSAIEGVIKELREQTRDIKELKEQMRHIKEHQARRDANIESQRVADYLDCSLGDAVEDAIDAGIDNATFSLPSPQCHTIDDSLGK